MIDINLKNLLFLDKFLNQFSMGLGVDLGTANSLVYVSGKGIVIDEPSVVAVDKNKDEILAIGKKALKMVGKTPPHIAAERPLSDGVISNFEVAEMMLSYFLNEVQSGYLGLRPRVVAAVPQGATEVDCNSVEDAIKNAGARKVSLIKEPVAAAIGARLPVNEAVGNMVVDIGGGTTEIAVVSLGGIVVEKDIRIAGNKLAEDVVDYIRTRFNLLIGEPTAERLKKTCGTALNPKDRVEDFIRGRDLLKGLPRRVQVDSNQIFRAMNKSVGLIVAAIKSTMEQVPPELVDDIMKRGILLTGGGAMLKGLSGRIEDQLDIPVNVAEDPLTTVVRGTGVVLEETEKYKSLLE